MERNGLFEKQWGPRLGSKCIEQVMGLKDIYKEMKDRIWQLMRCSGPWRSTFITPLY